MAAILWYFLMFCKYTFICVAMLNFATHLFNGDKVRRFFRNHMLFSWFVTIIMIVGLLMVMLEVFATRML